MEVKAAKHHQQPIQETPQVQVVPVAETPTVPQPQPIVEQVKVETPVETKIEPVQFDVNKYLSEKTGYNENELLTTLEKYKGINIEELSSKANKADEFEQRFKEVEPANEFVSELNKLLKNGASKEQVIEFYQLSQTDLTTLSPKEAEIMRLQKDKGLSKEDAEFSVERKLNKDVLDDETVRLNEIELKARFKDNVEYLKQYRKELSVTEAQKKSEELATKRQDYLQKVDAVVPQLAKELTSVKIADIAGDKDNPMPFEYVLPDEFRKEADKILRNVIVNNGYDVDRQNDIEQAKDVALKIAISSDPERYAKAIIKHYQAGLEERKANNGAKSVTETNGRQAVVVNNGTPTKPRVMFRARQ